MFPISSVELVTYFAWHRKAKKAADDGIFVDTPSTIKFQESILVILLIGAVYWLAIYLLYGMISISNNLHYKFRRL